MIHLNSINYTILNTHTYHKLIVSPSVGLLFILRRSKLSPFSLFFFFTFFVKKMTNMRIIVFFFWKRIHFHEVRLSHSSVNTTVSTQHRSESSRYEIGVEGSQGG